MANLSHEKLKRLRKISSEVLKKVIMAVQVKSEIPCRGKRTAKYTQL